MRILKWAIVLSVSMSGLVAFLARPYGQPTRERIVSYVKIEEDEGCAVIRVGFDFAVRYLSHFPYESGDQLHVKVEPIGITPNKKVLSRRESVAPPPHDFARLLEVVYAGDVEGGPYLTFVFRHPTAFRVGQGSDFRSLTVAVPGPEPSGPCLPTR